MDRTNAIFVSNPEAEPLTADTMRADDTPIIKGSALKALES